MENEKRLFDPDMKIIDKHFNKRLIDANALELEWLEPKCRTQTRRDFVAMLHYAPTVDAVEVVRCKDCHNCTKSMWCNLLMMDVKGEWFCCHGKRRETK